MENKLKSIFIKFPFLILGMMISIYAFAQTDTLPDSAYNIKNPKHVFSLYNGAFPFIVFGVVIVLILYVSYRYWHDNASRP